jgi:hypothetical protein
MDMGLQIASSQRLTGKIGVGRGKTYNGVNRGRVAQGVEDFIGPRQDIPEIKVKSEFDDFLCWQGTLPIRQFFPSGIFDDADQLACCENSFFIIEDEAGEQEIIFTRAAGEGLR